MSRRSGFRWRTTSSALPKLGVDRPTGRSRADDAAARELPGSRRPPAVELQHRLVEARLLERELHALHARQRRHQLVRARMAMPFASRARSPSGPMSVM